MIERGILLLKLGEESVIHLTYGFIGCCSAAGVDGETRGFYGGAPLLIKNGVRHACRAGVHPTDGRKGQKGRKGRKLGASEVFGFEAGNEDDNERFGGCP